MEAIEGLTRALHDPGRQPQDYIPTSPIEISVHAGVFRFRLIFETIISHKSSKPAAKPFSMYRDIWQTATTRPLSSGDSVLIRQCMPISLQFSISRPENEALGIINVRRAAFL